MPLSYKYSLCLELEYSHFDMFLIYELVYSPCIMIMSCLTSYNHVDIAMAYELAYSPHVMFMLYLIYRFHVHIISMDRNRFMMRWWFIMLSGTPKSFTCRSVGSGTAGDLGGH
jgi:hypothetical protein